MGNEVSPGLTVLKGQYEQFAWSTFGTSFFIKPQLQVWQAPSSVFTYNTSMGIGVSLSIL